MAEGASASIEGAFHTLSTSPSGAAESIAEAASTAGPAWIGEPASTKGREWSVEPLLARTGGGRPIAAANMNAG
jgi:hypothetical protein